MTCSTVPIKASPLIGALAKYSEWAASEYVQQRQAFAKNYANDTNKCRRWWRREPMSLEQALQILDRRRHEMSKTGLLFSNIYRRYENRLDWAIALTDAANSSLISGTGVVDLSVEDASRLNRWLGNA